MRLFSFVAIMCFLPASTTAFAQQADSITFVAARTLDGKPVMRGAPVPMEVTLRYSLESHKSAVLSLSTAQFRNHNRCTGGGELVDAEQRVVTRGNGFITINITWSGDTGEHSKGHIYHSGSLSFTGMFWKDDGGGRGPVNKWERYGIYDFYNDYCVPF